MQALHEPLTNARMVSNQLQFHIPPPAARCCCPLQGSDEGGAQRGNLGRRQFTDCDLCRCIPPLGADRGAVLQQFLGAPHTAQDLQQG
jgi:hypothetical protein